MTLSPIEVLRDREGVVIDAAEGDRQFVDEYRAALADVEKLVEAARRAVLLEYDPRRTDAENDELQRRGAALRDALRPFAES